MLPPDLLNKCKVIFVGRSPKDCCVSYYHHYLNLSALAKYNFKGTFPDFVQLFMTGMVGFGNYWTMLKVCTYSTYRLDYPVSIGSNYKIFLGHCPDKYVTYQFWLWIITLLVENRLTHNFSNLGVLKKSLLILFPLDFVTW